MNSFVSFREARKIALLYSAEFQKSNNLDLLIAELKKLGLEVSTMLYLDSTKENSETPYYNKNDIAVSGDLQKSDLDFFINQKYDFAVYLDNSLNYLLDYIFSKIDCHCRVGIYHPERLSFLDLMIQNTPSKPNIETEILRYLKLANT
ncbi:MAG: hypothetical protein JXR10_09005 [Cyclobacteriaceae bacterium]